MPRRYDSSNRKHQAQETRRRILDAAVELHARGITEVVPLAAAAGVSVPTVRKHFPSKERIFEGCTAHFFSTFTLPDLERAARSTDPRERSARVTEEMCRAHEATHDLMWHAYPEAARSAALAAALEGFVELIEAAVDVILNGVGEDVAARARPRLRALLDTLTYRAFRVHAGLDAQAVQRELTTLIASAIGTPPR